MTIAPFPQKDQLYDYLVGTSLSLNEISSIMDDTERVLGLTGMMGQAFAELYPQWLTYDAYYRGEPPMPQEPKRLTRKYRELLDMSYTNWCALIVDVVNERLKIGSIRSTGNAVQDKKAWEWWQANNMDGVAPQIHAACLRYGLCYISVWPRPGKPPRILGEPPTTCYVQYDADTGEPLAALRVWQDTARMKVNADLTTKDYQYHLTTEDVVLNELAMAYWLPSRAVTVDITDVRWVFRNDDVTVPVVRNPLGQVPYVKMLTAPDLTGGYASELKGLLPIQDRINKTNFDRMLAQSFLSFPRAWVTGIEVPSDPTTGKPKEPFDAAVDRLWTADDPNARFGQLDPGELTGYLEANTADVQALATASRTPPHFLLSGMGVFPSGESVRATEYGLYRKVQSRQQSYGDAWSDVLRLCGLVAGNKRMANDLNLNVVWDDVEARSEGEIVDALVKMGTLGVPWSSLWQRWGAKPEEITEWQKQLDEQRDREAEQLATQPLPGFPAVPRPGPAKPTGE